MLTAKEIQDLLQVDRSTIYRMAESGRIPAIKVGRQWRFPKERVETWLRSQSSNGVTSMEQAASPRHLSHLLPIECVQMVQNVFADVLGVMTVVTDMAGQPVTEVSRATGLLQVIIEVPQALQQCSCAWQNMGAGAHIEPRYEAGPLGLLFARGLIRVNSGLAGMVVMGGIAPEDWPPTDENLRLMSERLGVPESTLSVHLSEAFHKDYAERQKILSFVQPIADVIAHIVDERNVLMGRLEAIAQLTR